MANRGDVYSKRDLNPHSRCRPRDFKSLVSTIPPFEPQIWVLRAEDGTRIRDPNLGKVVLYQLSYFRNNVSMCAWCFCRLLHLPCQGWPFVHPLGQGCALPTELLPRVTIMSIVCLAFAKAAAKIYAISFLQNAGVKNGARAGTAISCIRSRCLAHRFRPCRV